MSRQYTLPMSQDQPLLDLDGAEFRRLGHQMVELMAETLEAERSDPVLQNVSGREIKGRFEEALPCTGSEPEAVLAECRRALLQHSRRNGHPRFFGYVSSSADPIGILADGLTSALNQNVTAWRSAPAATVIERLVIRWLDQMTGFAGGGHGLLVSGGSAANHQALACAVSLAEERAELSHGERGRLTVYVSGEAHLSLVKAARLLGLMPEHVRVIDVDADRRLRVDLLTRQLEADLAAGLVPAAICASAGTSNTGAIDPLDEIANLAARHRLWFHVDGAYGAPAAMVPEYHWMGRAFARADSLTLDPHKWLYTPIGAGCLLLRNAASSERAFKLESEYIAVTQTDPVERYAFFHHGLELTRRFRALKVWMILKTRGTDTIAAAIGRNIALCRRLDQRVRDHPRLEPLGSELSISCFRYLPADVCAVGAQGDDVEAVNDLNRTILETLVAEGRFYMSPTTLDGRYALRVCIVNFRTTERDIDLLIDEILRLGSVLC